MGGIVCLVALHFQVGLLNVDGYYNSLLAFMDKAVDEGFVTPAARHIIVSAHTPHDLMSKLEVHTYITIIIFINQHPTLHYITFFLSSIFKIISAVHFLI